MNKKNIMCIGIVVLDTVIEIDHFPEEDTDNRCQRLWRQTGGNASNSCTMLGIMGATPSFCGIIADSEQKFIEENFKKYGVDATAAVIEKGSECPKSYVITSLATGSRTIFHYNKNLRELKLDDFCAIDISQFAWIHFEGRNIREVKRMIEVVRKFNSTQGNDRTIRISVEIEKPAAELEQLIPLADVVFVSKDYAQYRGWVNINETLKNFASMIHHEAIAICAWGEVGAGSISNPEGSIHTCPSFLSSQVVDTLGAGDTFIGATILALAVGEPVEQSIIFGCKIAGFRVGLRGWSEFQDRIHELGELDYFKEIMNKI